MRISLILLFLRWLSDPGHVAAQIPAPDGFQGFHPGDLVQATVQKPFIGLGQATFQSQTTSNIVVISKGERFVLDKSTVTHSTPKKSAPWIAPVPAPTVSQESTSAESAVAQSEAQSMMQTVRQQILGPHSSEKGDDQASKNYQNTIQGFLDGQSSLGDIVKQAERTLEEVDKHPAERAADPQYENNIKLLRDFVRRAKAGEILQSDSKPE